MELRGGGEGWDLGGGGGSSLSGYIPRCFFGALVGVPGLVPAFGQEIAWWSGMVLGKHTLLRMQGALGIVLGTSTMARNHGGIYYLQLPGMAVPLSRKKDGNQCLETNTW